jgi:hypothetical protein
MSKNFLLTLRYQLGCFKINGHPTKRSELIEEKKDFAPQYLTLILGG